ncbi:MAG: ABC transporter ATP-binding protein, partial [Dehalococcoidia bacterium]
IIGPNGAGKTTLLRTIAALDRPTRGRVLLGPRPARPDRATREAIAYGFQAAVFLSGTVRSNLDTALRLRRVPGRERAARILEATTEFGIAHLLDRSARQLSGGEGQRANLARALCLRAPLTLLDEPLSGLDGPARSRMLDELPGLLRTFAETTIVVTHDRGEAFRLADDLVVIMAGRVRAAGEKGAIFRQPPDREVAAFLGYTLLPHSGRVVGVAPGALRTGTGAFEWEMTLDEVVDLGTHLEAQGRVAGHHVSVPLAEGSFSPGDLVPISATTAVGFDPD